MSFIDKTKVFEDELALIFRQDVKDFTVACINEAPDYVFYDCPSSSSGKYHPIEELGGDGTIIHTKKVFKLAYELTRALDCESRRDEVSAAALLHDLTKQGLKKAGHTIKEHPQIMARLIADVYKERFTDKLDRESAAIIYYCVYYHYGPWTDVQVRKDINKYSSMELSVFLADYIASRRFVHLNFDNRGVL